MWSQILLIFTAAVISVLFYKRVPKEQSDIRFFLIFSSLAAGITELFHLISFPYSDVIREYLLITLFTTILIILLMTIRVLKPSYARYPYPSVFLPALVLISYPFIQGVTALTSVIHQILQGGSIIVLVMLISAHYNQFKRGWMAVGIFITMLSAFLIYWVVPLFSEITVWMWQPFLIAGMIFSSLSFPRIFRDSRGPDIG